MTDPLTNAPDAVFRTWRHRERVENEAAFLFGDMAGELAHFYGPSDPVSSLALQAANDEIRHAERCRTILSFAKGKLPLLAPDRVSRLGAVGLTRKQTLLYSCVAVGCVTEALSSALLIEMRKTTAPGFVRKTVHEILADEITHSRIGWAELARAARSEDVSWLADFVPDMIRSAIVADVAPMLDDGIEPRRDLSRWGILPTTQARDVMIAVVDEIIVPGLSVHGVKIDRRQRAAESAASSL